MTTPLPKPRARYLIDKRTPSTDSNVVVTDEPLTNSGNIPLNHAECDDKLSTHNSTGDHASSDGSHAFREAGHTNGISEKLVLPVAPPPTSSTSVDMDDDMRALSEWAKESSSDSSADEGPLTSNLEKASSIETVKHHSSSNTENVGPITQHVGPPPSAPLENSIPLKSGKTKTPRAATIRVSRRKQAGTGSTNQNQESLAGEPAIARSSWLDVWKGRKHNVLWATFDGQLMSMWKKRSDKFMEYVFHVSSITSVRQQDKGRFSIYFRKKHFEFMAHSEDVQAGWVTSLIASRGRDPLAPAQQHSSLTLKDPRSKVYAAICGHNLWIYNSKEDFNLGLGNMFLSMNIASVKQTGRHSFSLITPYKTFNFSTDSSKDLNAWLSCLNEVIRSALSCSEVAQRLWVSPWNKVCADCGSPNPEWASINLLLVICEACAGVHRSMGTNRSKVRSLTLDCKVWTEPLIELFIIYGNKAANNVWGHNVPAADQIPPNATHEQRSDFITDKYCMGCYRRAHPLAASQALLNKRLCEVVCAADVEETLSLLCSGAKVHNSSGDPHCTSAIALAEKAGQALQTELLRHNEFVEAPDFDQQRKAQEQTGLEELHGKLDDERFLFSLENDSAACDVLDLREVISVFDRSKGENHEFEILTLTDSLSCNADSRESLLTHMLHIVRVLLPSMLLDKELEGVLAVSRLSVREGSGLQHAEVWATLRLGELLIYPSQPHSPPRSIPVTPNTEYDLHSSENTIEVIAAEKTLYLQFERQESCSSWYDLMPRASSAMKRSRQCSVYRLPAGVCGSVPPVLERCISHITLYGLKVEGLYRRCGTATKITQLVEEIRADPAEAVLGTDELDVLDVAGAMKQFLRQMHEIIPSSERNGWVNASALPQEAQRVQQYRKLVERLPPDNRITLASLCGHLYVVQLHSPVNRMTAHNLAVVFVPTLFQELAMNTNMVRLTKELIIHHALVFLSKKETPVEEEMITAL